MKELTLHEGGHPFSTADLLWLQQAFQESFASIYTAMLPADVDAAIVTGCFLDGSSTAITISDGLPGDWTTRKAGQVIWQGKLYDVLSGEVTGTFGPDPSTEVGLKLTLRTNAADYPSVFYANNIERNVYNDYVLEMVTADWDIPMEDLSLISNSHQKGTIVSFVPPAGSVLSDYVDPVTFAGKGRWRGWRMYTEAAGRVLVGYHDGDADFGTIGDTLGTKTVTLTANQSGVREHTHPIDVGGVSSGSTPTNVAGEDSGGTLIDTQGVQNVDGVGGRNGAQDALEAHNNIQPSLVVVHMIKL